MKVSTTQGERREAVLTVELDNEDVEPYLQQAYRQAVRRLSIPGFRKGKAPRRIVEQMYGRGYLLNQAMDTLIQEFTFKAVAVEGLELGGTPAVEMNDFDPPAFTAIIPLVPSVDLGDYESVRAGKDEVSVAEEEVDAILEQFRVQTAVWEPAEDAVQMDDLINLTISGWIDEEDGERRSVVHSEETDYIPRPGTGFPVPGLDEGLAGLTLGGPQSFEVAAPEDFANADVAGKTVRFEATIHSIKRRKLADLDDDFAREIDSEYDSLDALRDRIRADLTERAEQIARVRHESEALAQVVEGASVEISPLIVEREIDNYVREREETIKAGRLTFEDYQEYLSWQGMSEEEVRDQSRPKVEVRLKRAYVLRALAEQFGIEATDEDVDAEIEEVVGNVQAQADDVRALFEDPERRQSIRRALVQRKTLARITEIALGDGGAPAPADTPPEPGADSGAEPQPEGEGAQQSGGS